MKKIFRMLLATALFAGVVGCSADRTEDVVLPTLTDTEDFTAVLADESRTELGADNSVLWSATDKISIFRKTVLNREYAVKAGAGTTEATFKYVAYHGSDFTKTANAVNYGVYPFAAANALSTSGVATVTIPAEQEYTPGEALLNNSVMVGKSETTTIAFKNTESMVRFRLFSEVPGDFSIRKIRLESLSGRLLNGEATVDIEAADPVLTVTSGTSALTVNVEETVLTDVETVVYAVLPATAFAANDLKITFTAYNNLDAAEGTFEVTLPSALTLERGQITTLKYTFRAEEFKGTTEKWEEAGEVATAAELQQALNEGVEEISLQADVTLTEPLTIPATSSTTLATRAAGAGFTLDLNGYTISGTDTTTKNFGLINMQAGSVLNIVNTGATVGRLVLEATVDSGYARYSSVVSNGRGVLTVGENVEIEHLGGTTMAYGIDNLTNGKGTQAITIINGATVKSTYIPIRQFLNGVEATNELYVNSGVIGGTSSWSIFMQSPNNKANTGKLVVSENAQLKGDVFFGLEDNTTEWPVEVSIAEAALGVGVEMKSDPIPAGYHVAKLDGVWQVIEVEEGTVTSEESLAEALEQISAENDTVTLAPGEYVIPDTAKGETFAIVGTHNPEDTVISSQNDGGAEGECDYSLEGSTVTFENVTITTTSTYFPGYVRMKGIYKNCIINGVYTLYDDSEFVDCTFNISGDFYNVWTWGALNATFTRCTFNCDGKAVLLYGQANTTLTMKECTFNDNGGLPDLKAAIEIGNDYGTSYNLIVNEATVNGFEINDKGINTGTTLWANKNSMTPEKLNVVVDGVDVY